MRITKEELAYSDITWFAVDKHGRIIEFTSAGSGNVPEFVCASMENTDLLTDYFADLSERLYYFDACDGRNRTTNYIKKTSPSDPLQFSQLPVHISDILSKNRLDIDVENVEAITVEHAYDTEISLGHFASLIIKGQFPVNFKYKYLSVDFRTKLKFRKVMKMFKKDTSTSLMEIKSIVEKVEQTEITKQYYLITTSQENFVLYLVYKSDIMLFDEGGLYSLQITRKNETVFDFNDKAGVLICE